MTEHWEAETAVLAPGSDRELVDSLLPLLTPAEVRVLQGLRLGLDIGDIAQELGVSHQAVSKHRRSIAQLVAFLETPRPARRDQSWLPILASCPRTPDPRWPR